MLCTSALAQQIPQPPAADASTPEAALRSYWALKDWYEAAWRMERVERKSDALFERLVAELTRGKPQRFYEGLAAYRRMDVGARLERKIASMRQESPERVVIEANIRNVSPVPAGVQSTAFLQKLRDAGENYRYVIAREGERWHILEIWNLWTGVMAPKEQYDTPPQQLFPAHVPSQ